jgi:hypothetical protein
MDFNISQLNRLKFKIYPSIYIFGHKSQFQWGAAVMVIVVLINLHAAHFTFPFTDEVG